MEQKQIYEKIYIDVQARFTSDGVLKPTGFWWTNGRFYVIDRVCSMKRAAARKAGGQGDCYTIQVNGKERQLFYDHFDNRGDNQTGRWFVEAALK